MIKCLLALDEPLYEDSPDDKEPLKKEVLEKLGDEVQFIDMDPRYLGSSKMPNSIDLCIVDFGGVASLPGSSVGSMYARNLVQAISDRPGTLFMVWSTFSVRWYRDTVLEILEEEIGEEVDDDRFQCPANVMLYPVDKNWDFDKEQADKELAWEKAKVWLSGVTK